MMVLKEKEEISTRGVEWTEEGKTNEGNEERNIERHDVEKPGKGLKNYIGPTFLLTMDPFMVQ